MPPKWTPDIPFQTTRQPNPLKGVARDRYHHTFPPGGPWGGSNKSIAGNSVWRVGSIETLVAYPHPAMKNQTIDQGI
ncbi:hypothetical protein DFH07DRAFT_946844, partial [Mycena maculata]